MRRISVGAWATCLLWPIAGAAQAPVCDAGDATPAATAEPVRAALLQADMAKAMAGFDNDPAALQRFQDLLPAGYDACTVIVQRRDEGGMTQEITVFSSADSRPNGTLALYSVTAPINGDERLLRAEVFTSVPEAFGNLF